MSETHQLPDDPSTLVWASFITREAVENWSEGQINALREALDHIVRVTFEDFDYYRITAEGK